MDNLKQLTNDKIAELNQEVEKMRAFLAKAPQGTLKIHRKKNQPFYYWQKKGEDEKLEQIYLPKSEMQKIKDLAQKRYFEKLKPVMEENIKALMTFQKNYHFVEMDDVYDKLSSMRKELVQPYKKTLDEIIAEWNSEVYEQNQSHAESLRYDTDGGEVVRSKSEVIIANELYKHRNQLLYKYERPLELENHGQKYTIHPDFTIINLKTGGITYWEHAGLMDDAKYAADFVWKNNLYFANGIVPGKDVIFSYETQENSLETGIVKKMVQQLCEEKCE